MDSLFFIASKTLGMIARVETWFTTVEMELAEQIRPVVDHNLTVVFYDLTELHLFCWRLMKRSDAGECGE